jgi:type IV secretory pathway VirB2 component (pilin)
MNVALVNGPEQNGRQRGVDATAFRARRSTRNPRTDPFGDDARTRERVGDGLAVVVLILAALTGVVVFLPAQGYIATPLHDGLHALLGRLTFALPVVLLVGGVTRLLHVAVPVGRLGGLAVLLVAVLVAEHLVSAGDSGLAGQWLATLLQDALGQLATALLVLVALVVGGVLTFGVRIGWR